MSDAPVFSVTLHHLAPGAKQAGTTFPDVPLGGVSEKKLRELIRGLGALAPGNFSPATPELRVVAPHGQFVVQISQGRLRINSWTIKVGGADLSPDQIFTLITGAEAVAEVADERPANAPKRSRGGLVVVLALLIIGSNAVTAWLLTRPQPPPPLLPAFAPLAAEPAGRFLSDIAGDYQTGAKAGRRALKVSKDGKVHWQLFGPDGAVVEDNALVTQPVQSGGRAALLADQRALIEVVEGGSLLFYNETYRRKAP